MKDSGEFDGKFRLIMLALAFLISFLLHILLFGVSPMRADMVAEMGLSNADFGFIFSVTIVGLMFLRIPWGVLADRYGYKQVLRVSLPLTSISAILRGLSTGHYTFLLSQFFLGVGLASVLPCMTMIVRDWYPSRTGFATGIYVSGFATGNAVALGLTPYLLQLAGWRSVLISYGLVSMVVTALWWVLARGGMNFDESYGLSDAMNLFRERYVWVLTLFVIACMGSYDALAHWMPTVLELKNMSVSVAMLLPVGFLLSGPVVGFISDKLHGDGWLVALLGVASGLSTIAVALVSGPYIYIFVFLAGFFVMGLLTLTLRAPAEHSRLAGSAGKVSGVISSVGNVGPLFLPVVFGFFLDVTGTYFISILVIALVEFSVFLVGSMFWE